uniref:Rho GTPase activating protein 17b n=1 Tax=Callorhinchus milii TaxID=7868 RepID=A0A4W3H4U0_CALMI
KTEVLSDDLLQIEKRIDTIRVVSHNTHKRLLTCLQVPQGTEVEKRHKKIPLMGLSQCMQEGFTSMGDDSLIGKLLEICSEAESKLAWELAQHEVQIEKDVLDPFSSLVEVDIPNIQKQRKQLARLVLDWDSAKIRHYQMQKTSFSGANIQAVAAKVDSLREEMEEAGNKVEQCKDQLASDMYNFTSKEGDYANYYVTLLEAQADYHRKSLAVLERVLPTIHTQQETWTEKPAFGTALEEHLQRSGREIALPLEACVMMLLETGMKEEGLFRIAAGASKLKKLKAALDCSTSQLEEFYSDPHAVAGALKSYLRELPEPLMTYQLYEEWIHAAGLSDPERKLQALWTVCNKLPQPNHTNLSYLIKFLAKLAQNRDINKMTPTNIAIVLGPNLLWAKSEGTMSDMTAATSVQAVTVIEPILHHADWFFPDEIDFNKSGMFSPMAPASLNSECESGTLERKRPVSLPAAEDPGKKDGYVLHRHLVLLSDVVFPSLRSKGGKGGFLKHRPMRTICQQGGHALYAGRRLRALYSLGSRDQARGRGGKVTKGAVKKKANYRGKHLNEQRTNFVFLLATKKPAPAPPKTSNPPPGQPAGQGANPQPGGQSGGLSPGQPVVQPRRHSSNQTSIHAPSHPPPQPPAQGREQGAHSSGYQFVQDPPAHPSLPSPTGSLQRPRPTPKPRIRPTIRPPPQPALPSPTPSLTTDHLLAGTSATASKIVTGEVSCPRWWTVEIAEELGRGSFTEPLFCASTLQLAPGAKVETIPGQDELDIICLLLYTQLGK